MIRAVAVENAVGLTLSHDITQILPGRFKGPLFKKGHIITEEDIPRLLDIGKENIYVLDIAAGWLHENDAAARIARAAAGPGIWLGNVSEGRVNFISDRRGLLKVDVEALQRINRIEEIVLGTLHTDHDVAAGTPVAGTRIIPLLTTEEKIRQVEGICSARDPVVQVKAFNALRVGVVTTGSEVYHGRIQDGFGPILKDKFAALGSEVTRQVFVSDDVGTTVAAIHELIANGAQLVALTGGMSVDPDDQTPAGIRASGAEIVCYGAPTFPGAMFMLAYLEGTPVIGLPGCVMYHKASIFDLVVPRILAGETVTREEVIRLAHGGFCAGCADCRYPLCGFGKG